MTRLALCLVLLVSACTPAQAPIARRVGMVMSVGGVVGIVGSAFATRYTERADAGLLGFSIVSAAGILLYAAGDLSQPETVYKQESLPQRHHRWAKILTEHAAGAARSGNCARVRKFEPRVRVYDAEVHDFVFMRDPEILRCLSRTTPSP
jgi:hypothetical protein